MLWWSRIFSIHGCLTACSLFQSGLESLLPCHIGDRWHPYSEKSGWRWSGADISLPVTSLLLCTMRVEGLAAAWWPYMVGRPYYTRLQVKVVHRRLLCSIRSLPGHVSPSSSIGVRVDLRYFRDWVLLNILWIRWEINIFSNFSTQYIHQHSHDEVTRPCWKMP